MVIRRSTGERIFDAFNIIFMILLMVVTLYPLLYVVFASVSTPSVLVQHRGLLLKPLGFETGSYGLVFKNPMIPKGYLNTLFIVTDDGYWRYGSGTGCGDSKVCYYRSCYPADIVHISIPSEIFCKRSYDWSYKGIKAIWKLYKFKQINVE